MSKLVTSALILALGTTLASAHHEATEPGPAVQMISKLPANSWPVTDWYKQSVYDSSDNKIGEVVDMILDHDGKTVAIMIGVGGFIGVGEKDVAVPYNAVQFKKKDNKWYLHMNSTKDALKSAPGYKYDRNAMEWMPENAPSTTGAAPRPNGK
jgi:sporulation protein YlmC with PRC-barrel domain